MYLERRADWGARAPKGRPKDISAPVKHLVLHHSAGVDAGEAAVRSIQSFHMDTRGWQDIGYTWLYSPSERTFYEGRGPGVRGAHTRGYNHIAHAVCVLGNYQTDVPAPHVVDDLAVWAEWHGATWGPAVYEPHSKFGKTACPGRHLHALLDDINDLAGDLTGPDQHRASEMGHWEWLLETGGMP